MPTTTTLTATRAWLTDPLNPSVALTCGTRQGTWVETLDGGVDYYAGGVAKAATRDQDTVVTPITLIALSWVQVAQLRAWRGRTLLLRTVDGERRYGVFYEMQRTRRLRSTPSDDTDAIASYDVDLNFQAVSWTAVVT